jgi:hypothetical protein
MLNKEERREDEWDSRLGRIGPPHRILDGGEQPASLSGRINPTESPSIHWRCGLNEAMKINPLPPAGNLGTAVQPADGS